MIKLFSSGIEGCCSDSYEFLLVNVYHVNPCVYLSFDIEIHKKIDAEHILLSVR